MSEFDALIGRAILITGADGMLGRAFADVLAAEAGGAVVYATSRRALDVTNRDAVLRLRDRPLDIIVHCAGMSLADQCEREPEQAAAAHIGGTIHVAELALATGARVFYPQSVFIFDGRELPVTESTIPAPTFTYGRVKLEAERHLIATVPGALVVRMAGFFGGDAKDKNFVGKFTRQLRDMIKVGSRECVAGDRVWQPTYTVDLARNVLLLLALGRSGVYHMGALGEATFFDVAMACVRDLGLEGHIRVTPCPAALVSSSEMAARPHRMVTATARLDAEGFNRQRAWGEALSEYLARPYFDDLRAGPRATA